MEINFLMFISMFLFSFLLFLGACDNCQSQILHSDCIRWNCSHRNAGEASLSDRSQWNHLVIIHSVDE